MKQLTKEESMALCKASRLRHDDLLQEYREKEMQELLELAESEDEQIAAEKIVDKI